MPAAGVDNKAMSDYYPHEATCRVEGQYLLENGAPDSIVF